MFVRVFPNGAEIHSLSAEHAGLAALHSVFSIEVWQLGEGIVLSTRISLVLKLPPWSVLTVSAGPPVKVHSYSCMKLGSLSMQI